jgi:protein-L-isoaspartate(D-aspartate) O-methyltransferase
VTRHDAARYNMVDRQLRPNKVHDERVQDAFRCIRRERFVPERLRALAYIDEDLPVAPGRHLMEPMVAARLIQALAVQPKETALVVGAGVGYEAAVLSQLGRSVVALEEDAELARIGRSGLVDHRIASVAYVEAPPRPGHRPRAPYDAILFGGAVAYIPEDIAAQLAEGGRMAVVLRQHGPIGRAVLICRTGTILAQRVIFDAATPLLPGFEANPGFVF